jgi:hypothetical protein
MHHILMHPVFIPSLKRRSKELLIVLIPSLKRRGLKELRVVAAAIWLTAPEAV